MIPLAEVANDHAIRQLNDRRERWSVKVSLSFQGGTLDANWRTSVTGVILIREAGSNT